jgi:hypothetical protein
VTPMQQREASGADSAFAEPRFQRQKIITKQRNTERTTKTKQATPRVRAAGYDAERARSSVLRTI